MPADLLKKYVTMVGTGLFRTAAPGITQGALIKLLKNYQVTPQVAFEWVKQNENLWDHLSPAHQNSLRKILHDAGKLDWFTAPWLLNAIRKAHYPLTSLFLGWHEGYTWLEYQINYIKAQVK